MIKIIIIMGRNRWNAVTVVFLSARARNEQIWILSEEANLKWHRKYGMQRRQNRGYDVY